MHLATLASPPRGVRHIVNPPSHDALPPIEFADARGARLAYQAFGSGAHTIVSIPPLAQNIELAWEWSEIRSMLERFGSFSRFVHFDKRGTGASGRRTAVNGIDERVDDLRAVMDTAGIDHAFLFASSEGGPMALLFAATHPERVDGLILNGTGASMMHKNMTDAERDASRGRQDQFVTEWGTPKSRVVERFAPSLAGDAEFCRWHLRYERHAASRESLRELLELSLHMDVHEVLAHLDTPTLVVHRTDDQVIPVAFGRELAEMIPGAQMFEQPGDDHFSYAGDMDGWMDEVERFVTGSVAPPTRHVRPPGAVRILTLGGFAVEIGGEPVPTAAWGSRRARQLCKRLVAARGWPVTRDELIDMLWPEEADMDRLSARLSVQLSAVRRVLGGGVIADRETVRLNLDEVSTDIEDLYLATVDQEIVDAYPGEFLPEDRYDDWTMSTRDEARTKFVAAATHLTESSIGNGDTQSATELAHRLIASDQFDGDARALLVRALLAAGHQREASRARDAWAAAFAELGIDVPPLSTFAGS